MEIVTAMGVSCDAVRGITTVISDTHHATFHQSVPASKGTIMAREREYDQPIDGGVVEQRLKLLLECVGPHRHLKSQESVHDTGIAVAVLPRPAEPRRRRRRARDGVADKATAEGLNGPVILDASVRAVASVFQAWAAHLSERAEREASLIIDRHLTLEERRLVFCPD